LLQGIHKLLFVFTGRVGEDEEESWESGSEGDLASEAASAHGCGHLHDVKKALNDPTSGLYAEIMGEDGGTTSRTDRSDLTGAAGVELTAYVESQFRSLAQQDERLFESCCRLLNPHQLQAVQATLTLTPTPLNPVSDQGLGSNQSL